MCGSGDTQKLVIFVRVFNMRDVSPTIVHFEKCHSPLRSGLRPTGTVLGGGIGKRTNNN
jgi:hypothetical protein